MVDKVEQNNSKPLIVVRELHKDYEEVEVLDGVSFEVHEGDLVSIIGPSGCGKSTLLRCLNCIEELDSGEIIVDGVQLRRDVAGGSVGRGALEEKAHALRERMGMVFQALNLFPHKTILENVMMGPMVVKGLTKDAALEQAVQQLKHVGLSHYGNRLPGSLSGGQQQRAAIARALAMEPKVMLYDEPTSSLDPERVEEVLQVMRDLDAEGMTQIVVTHEMRFARDASDYIIYMEGGQIVEISDEDEIFEAPKDERTRRFLKKFMVD